MTKQSNLVLKTLAQQAKDRLRGKSEKVTNITYQRNFKVLFNANRSDIKSTIISNKEDEKLYAKVRQILQNGEPINAAKLLIDKSYYTTLQSQEKERYFFDLMDKYRKLKERYENEKVEQEYTSQLI